MKGGEALKKEKEFQAFWKAVNEDHDLGVLESLASAVPEDKS